MYAKLPPSIPKSLERDRGSKRWCPFKELENVKVKEVSLWIQRDSIIFRIHFIGFSMWMESEQDPYRRFIVDNISGDPIRLGPGPILTLYRVETDVKTLTKT